MGNTKSTNRTVYMLDFGLARQYVNNEGNVRAVSGLFFTFCYFLGSNDVFQNFEPKDFRNNDVVHVLVD